ncbi:helix-turn-helix transcriptional regulator [Paramixta manurensis]|uniref:Helix-turn-helix transcriptional regulator n=1 Tax=Paramixta manurensis TaxID=2740817 RepID=A0A6M8UE80_9GAMM|nr:helix-turn-helix transcriptional regulator [Erwiniaceae bacterium PD-1]
MNKPYHAFENLRQHRARLRNSVQLGSGIQLAAWSNDFDCVTQRSDHHTLSLYVEAGYHTWHKTPAGWKNGGAPDRFCLMPEQSESTWDVRDEFSFVHLYCTDAHLRQVAEQIWDRSPASLTLQEKVFADDAHITQLYRHFLLNCDWRQNANHLTLSSASTLLMSHLVQHYSNVLWKLPTLRGGLAPVVLRRVTTFIEENLNAPLTLADLAAQAELSEFHFARMFRQSTKLAPHQYVMQRRMAKAEQLVRHSALPLTEIALICGFSSSSHFSNRFKSVLGYSPSALRRGN